MRCQFCHSNPCTCLETFYPPPTTQSWVDNLNTAEEDLIYGREHGDIDAITFAGVRWATAKEALEQEGKTPYWDEQSREWKV